MKKYNFFAGPAILPAPVIDQAANAVKDFDGMGLSLIEISHRSKPFVEVMENARALVKKTLKLDDSYEVLFLQGGASSQFYMVPYNLLNKDSTASYLDTGSWASKAIKEASAFGEVDVLGSSKEANYNFIPKDYEIPGHHAYFHLTSNNTIYGTQVHDFPETSVTKVVDMSSDIFCRPIDASQFGLIYAGAQKNLGPAGTTLLIVNKGILGKVNHHIPTMIDYRTHINKDSMFNTPPVFPVYVCYLTLQWIEQMGGLAAMETRNREKADTLYGEIDRNGLFRGTTAKEDRSLMNVTFVCEQAELDEHFISLTAEAGCVGLKGHRSVGGFRASIYNAMDLEGVQVLVEVMKTFEQKYG